MMIVTQGTISVDGLERFADQAFGTPATYTYHINLDERGYFYADVRNSSGKTVYEVKAGNSLDDPDNETSIFDDGFMRDKHDMAGLKEYLVGLGIMSSKTVLVDEETKRAASVPRKARTSRAVFSCSGRVQLVGGIDDARRAIVKDGFDPRNLVVASYDPDEMLADPPFPTDSKAAILAHASRCGLRLSTLAEAGTPVDVTSFIVDLMGNGSPVAGWAALSGNASRHERRMP